VRTVRELQVLESAIRDAGRAVMRIRAEGFETRMKGRGNPVTAADLEANRILKEKLLGAFPGDGWLSEETRDDRERLARRRVWIVDPIDGTKEFVSGLPEFAVSVALVEEGRPLAGALLNPAEGALIIGARGLGVRRDGRPVRAERPPGERLEILASRTEVGRGEFKTFERDATVRPIGSIAWKLGLVACGDGDATFSLGPKNEWDIAAGVALVLEAGGSATDRHGAEISFNRPVTLVPGIVAATAQSAVRVRNLIREGTNPS
jgi:myo-inositol-1(or 4)-monophosphatase